MYEYLQRLLTAALLGALLLLPAPVHAQQSTPRLSCRFQPASIPSGQQAALLVELADVQNIYGYELKMTYETGHLQALDGDSGKDGVNLQLGSFLSPDFVLFNTAENGSLHLALTQLAPATGKSGSGELARITFQGANDGFANFVFGEVTLSDANGQAITVTTQDCLLEIGAAGQPTPTATPVPTNTPTTAAVATHTPTSAQNSTNTQTLLNTQTAVAPATQTPIPATPVPQPPTPTWTPSPISSSTPPPTESPTPEGPTPTATVLTFSIPTPSGDSVEGASVAQVQPTPQPSDITPTATTLVEQTVSEPLTPSPEARESVPASTTGVSTPIAEVVALLQPTQTATPTVTPITIAQVGRAVPLIVESVQQPLDSTQRAKPGFLQGLGWIFLFFTSVLAIVAWRMRKA